MAMIVSEIVTDFVNAAIDQFPSKSAIYQNGLATQVPPAFSKALNLFEGGERIKVPKWKMEQSAWEVAPSGAALTMRQLDTITEFGVITRRRKYFGQYKLNDLINTWGETASQELGKQILEQLKNEIDNSMVAVLAGAIPAPNTSDVAVTSGTAITADAPIIITGKNVLGDKSGNLKIMVCHSKVFGDIQKIAYGSYITSPLANPQKAIGDAWYEAGGMIIYVTDKCPVDMTTPNYFKYTSYLLGLHQVYIANQGGFEFKMGEDLKHDMAEMLAASNYVAHLRGASWRTTSPANPTNVNLGTPALWELGVTSAEQIQAVKLITN